MTQQINPKLGELNLMLATVRLQAAQYTLEAGVANILISGAALLQQEYSEQIAGVQSIYAPHSANHQFSISIIFSVDPNGSYTSKTFYFNDPGEPPVGITGTTAEAYIDETDGTAQVYDQYNETKENALQTMLQSDQASMQELSNDQQNTISLGGVVIQMMEYATNLFQGL